MKGIDDSREATSPQPPLPEDPAERGLLGKRHPGELANVATHFVALWISLPAVWLVVTHAQTGADRWSALVYGLTLIGAYMASTALHSGVLLSVEHRLRYWLEIFDHVAIYLFIAGTFTPFMLRVPGRLGLVLLAGGWAAAGAGVVFKLIWGLKYERLSLASYLLMGWFPLLAVRPIMQSSSVDAVQWLIIGGLAYTAGVPFFVAAHRYPRLHCIWHIFVMLGSAAHYIAVWGTLAAPRAVAGSL